MNDTDKAVLKLLTTVVVGIGLAYLAYRVYLIDYLGVNPLQ